MIWWGWALIIIFGGAMIVGSLGPRLMETFFKLLKKYNEEKHGLEKHKENLESKDLPGEATTSSGRP